MSNKTIRFSFVHEDPGSFAGIGLNLPEYPAFFDISPFSSVHITLSAANIRSCTVTLKLFVHGITDISDDTSYRHFGFAFPIKTEKTDYILPLSRFQDAAWWIRDYNPKRKKIGNKSLKNACFLLIETPPGNEPDASKTSSISVYHISLYKSYSLFYILAGAGAGCYYLLIFAFIFIRKKRHRSLEKEPKRIIEYKKLMVENYRETDL